MSRTHTWVYKSGRQIPYCQDCGTENPHCPCLGPQAKATKFDKYLQDYADALAATMYSAAGLVEPKVTVGVDKARCTCPLHGPEGLLARGCSCGGA